MGFSPEIIVFYAENDYQVLLLPKIGAIYVIILSRKVKNSFEMVKM